ncbi:DDE superfamily endonuclease [Halogranum amylolyticum]|uniref:DDE superfamily endonuclease n=1 Tax=Halogranum amylolyticum TaxID=660520 RepID=A0A1H8WMC4_9EURY|nr:DDE superfamily endonuclease [Halogranum amylolyticum]
MCTSQTARPYHQKTDPVAKQQWRDEFKKKWPRLKRAGYTIVAIDQHTQAVATIKRRDWFPVNSRPRLPVSVGREVINMLGAVTDSGDRFVALTPNRFKAEVSQHFLRALQHEFGPKLVIVLDNAKYFIATDFKKQAAADGLLLDSCRRTPQT